MPDSYFSRTPKIRSHGEMEALLEQRAPGGLAKPKPTGLEWMPPTRKPDGSGNQMSRCGQFEVRKTLNEKGPTYWAWRGRRLLGYATDVQGAYDYCTASLGRDP